MKTGVRTRMVACVILSSLDYTCSCSYSTRSAFSETMGRRTVYLVSFALFVIFSILSAVSTSIAMLIVMRILGGGAAASVQAVGAGTIADIFVSIHIYLNGRGNSLYGSVLTDNITGSLRARARNWVILSRSPSRPPPRTHYWRCSNSVLRVAQFAVVPRHLRCRGMAPHIFVSSRDPSQETVSTVTTTTTSNRSKSYRQDGIPRQ